MPAPGRLGGWAAGRIASDASDASDASRVRCVLIGLAGTALRIGLAGLSATVVVLAVCLTLLGAFNGGANAAIGPLYVLRPAEAERGKVLAAINGVSRAGSILALGLGGGCRRRMARASGDLCGRCDLCAAGRCRAGTVSAQG